MHPYAAPSLATAPRFPRRRLRWLVAVPLLVVLALPVAGGYHFLHKGSRSALVTELESVPVPPDWRFVTEIYDRGFFCFDACATLTRRYRVPHPGCPTALDDLRRLGWSLFRVDATRSPAGHRVVAADTCDTDFGPFQLGRPPSPPGDRIAVDMNADDTIDFTIEEQG